jgi:uncharacterized protein with HEPN domain
MEKEIETYLFDIQNSIGEIESFFAGRPKVFAEYKNDVRTKRAVERNIEIIGEAMNRILKLDDRVIIENARNIVGTRNRIIHGYDSVSDEHIWAIVINNLPELKKEVEKLLQL